MQLKQKKWSNEHIFSFDSETFNFAYKDKSGAGDFDIPYEEFPLKSQVKIEQNDWLRNAGYIWCVIGALQILYTLLNGEHASSSGFWLFIGLLCLFAHYFTKVRYSVFQTGVANVFVIQDGRMHDKVIEEIKSRKKALLKSRYGEINSDNSIENEINKFKWLAEQQILTKTEADMKIAQLEFRHKAIDSRPVL